MWIDPETKEVARSHSDIRNLRQNWSGPAIITDDMISDLGFSQVTMTLPQFDSVHQVANELPPKLIEGDWTQQWEITDLNDDQVAANLGAAVSAKNSGINAARLSANFSSFSYAGKLIACDTLSRSDIDGANGYISLFGTLPPDWLGGWKAVDNSYVPITTVDEWKAFFKAMYDQGITNFKHSQALKDRLTKAKTASDIDAIIWTSP